MEPIREVGGKFRSLSEPWADTTTHAGKMIMTIFAGIADDAEGAIMVPSALEGNCCRPPRLAGSTGIGPVPELFVNAEAAAMTRAGFEYILDKHVCAATKSCTSLSGRSVSPHQLRHSCAVIMLQATRDVRKVALWLGHADIRTTEIYLRVRIIRFCGAPQNAEFERDLIRERTSAGREAAQKRGVRFGRPRKLSTDQQQLARRLVLEGKAVSDIARTFNVHAATI